MSDWLKLDHLGAILVRGSDAAAFAQAQFTADFTGLEKECYQPTAWCSAKGRVVAFILAAHGEDGVDLVLPRAQLDTVGARLPMFAIGRDVNISTATEVAGRFGGDGGFPLAFDRGRRLQVDSACSAEDSGLRLEWQRADLAAGMAWLTPETSDRYLPQMLGLEQLGGISYQKGCYPGQEVIARTHYLGRVKRQLTGLQLEDHADLPPGQPVNDENDSKIGELLWSIPEPGRTVALAVMDASVDHGTPVAIESERGRLGGQVTPLESLC